MKIAVVGCAHGELDKIYELIETIQQRERYQIDLLLCCGDFQSTRNLGDLLCMAQPLHHLDMGTFYKYYSGEKIAPVLTLFIGGNHEASNYLQELPYGGWVAPNVYYLGYAGVVNVNGLRVGGISGIFKGYDYLRGRFEFSPFDEETKRSLYHIRHIDVYRLKQLTPRVDIFLSHDWPTGVTAYGNCDELFATKPRFEEQVKYNTLGSPPCEDILRTVKPSYWFAAHLHCKFPALIPHQDGGCTKFLALDKCLPEKPFLQVLDIGSDEVGVGQGKVDLCYDLEWLTILKLTNHLISVKDSNGYMPGDRGAVRFKFTPTDDQKRAVLQRFQNDLRVPLNFTRIVEPYNPTIEQDLDLIEQPIAFVNAQTTELCEKLNIDDPLRMVMLMTGHSLNTSTYVDQMPTSVSASSERNEGEVPLADDAQVPLASDVLKPMKRQDSASGMTPLVDSSLSKQSLLTSKKHDSTVSDDTVDDLNLCRLKLSTGESETISPLSTEGIAMLPADDARSDEQEQG